MTHKLCYIDGNQAYFTNQELEKQWGDDWDDAPYEHNAGEPYPPPRPDLPDRMEMWPNSWNPDGTPKWEVIKIMFDGDFLQPKDYHPNSPYSVEKLNTGIFPWLRTSDEKAFIRAGATIKEFTEFVKTHGGEVYFPITEHI
jgi:hypothetical protein